MPRVMLVSHPNLLSFGFPHLNLPFIFKTRSLISEQHSHVYILQDRLPRSGGRGSSLAVSGRYRAWIIEARPDLSNCDSSSGGQLVSDAIDQFFCKASMCPLDINVRFDLQNGPSVAGHAIGTACVCIDHVPSAVCVERGCVCPVSSITSVCKAVFMAITLLTKIISCSPCSIGNLLGEHNAKRAGVAARSSTLR